uniref:Uncharacterized protein n=1 Tax=Brassica oleracea TaxID=3712 RepID=A0A3P6D0Q4_BRAOL|nr:unnamed protein product [Brassica oleracea]
METLKILKFGGGVDIELSPTFGTSTLPCRDQQGITEIHLTKQSRDSINLKELESSLGEGKESFRLWQYNLPRSSLSSVLDGFLEFPSGLVGW